VWKLLQSGKAPEALERTRSCAGSPASPASAAGLSTTKPGGIFSVPALSEVEQILKNW
jgi:hypothetical protein